MAGLSSMLTKLKKSAGINHNDKSAAIIINEMINSPKETSTKANVTTLVMEIYQHQPLSYQN